ncbi:hypothetical protein GCM10022386_07220 [Flavobacterium cheonhonense]|uniref:Uncharacterized protein n=1 Tax=Flavobacterium cheonhonense TaxID=706185 RepID=A0ABP7THJ7_9FLAO|nr:hypothetical protein [Flavobacterium cheonhonense]
MNLLDTIAIKGLTVAKENGLLDLPEKKEIPFDEEIIEDFLNRVIDDLFEFATLEQYVSNETLFARATVYVYGKGVEFALSHICNTPLERISYNFDDCMQSKIPDSLPHSILNDVNTFIPVVKEMYRVMFQETKGSQEKFIVAGITFRNCIFKILSGVFFAGRKVGLSIVIDENNAIQNSNTNSDSKYDYDTYDSRYKENEFE